MSDRPGDPDSEEEALRWEGDEQLGRVSSRPRRSPLDPDPNHVDAQEAELERLGDELDGPAEADIVPPPAGRRAATAVFVIVYLLVVVGWVLSVQRTASGSTNVFVDVTWQFGEFMAMAAGVLVFGTVHSLTRDRATWVAVSWWLVGLLLLLPWPILVLLLSGAGG